MKKLIYLLPFVFIVLLSACSGSETYRGQWKATDADGNKYDITFAENSFTVKDTTGKSSDFKYTQNSVNIENGVETYGIKLEDGRDYQINFPIAKTENKGIIKDGNGVPVYTISKNSYLRYEDLYILK